LDDFLHFGRMLPNKGTADSVCLLSRKTVEAMTVDYLTAVQHSHPCPLGPDYWETRGMGLRLYVTSLSLHSKPG
jgi:hypothetical protein